MAYVPNAFGPQLATSLFACPDMLRFAAWDQSLTSVVPDAAATERLALARPIKPLKTKRNF